MRALSFEAVAVGKRFGSFWALDDVSMRVEAGGFHALLGENGAGKSTLVKCLVGYQMPDKGSFIIGEREATIRNPREAQQLGIGMVYQHFTLAPGMTVAENLVLARGNLPLRIDWRAEKEALSAFMGRMPFHLDLNREVSMLAAGQKQKLEILKQLYLQQRILILDEPTSVLTPSEADEVLDLLRKLSQQGELTVLMITHKFREVMAYADSVAVLRHGKLVGSGSTTELSANDMAALMMGASVSTAISGTRQARIDASGEVRLAIEALEVDNDRGSPAVRKLDLAVRAGEIMGIAGIAGNGQREMVEALLGQRPVRAGTVRVEGEIWHATRHEMQQHQVFSLPEEPLRNACVPGLSVAENMALRGFDRPPLAHDWWLDRNAMVRQSRRLIDDFGVRPPNPEAAIGTLSGGNIQRVVLARELSEPVRVLIVTNPVFGLDFVATAAIHQRLLAARNAGAAILLVSEDIDELLELADWIAVISEGRIVYKIAASAADRTEIGQYMAGEHHTGESV